MATECYLLSVQGTLGNEYRENVLAFQSTGSTATNTFDAGFSLINGWVANLHSHWLDLFPSSYQVMRLEARRAFPAPSAVAHVQFNQGQWQGTDGSNATAQQLCPSVFLVPPTGVKSGGRIFMPCIAQNQIQDNVFTSAWRTLLSAFMTPAFSGFTQSGIGWELGIYSRKLQQINVALGFHVSPRIGFQSKRRSPMGGM